MLKIWAYYFVQSTKMIGRHIIVSLFLFDTHKSIQIEYGAKMAIAPFAIGILRRISHKVFYVI